ncbi:MAG: alcohol dehydrogenase catalytic domain-containing protein [Bacillota bacterium]|jgi:threonine dehydrogenase-like Zn-dependent dehydrogenase|nr:alcohol dehydrogenase catalytic domain-containing protein [Bacillota bacterium]HHT89936.1 alcohol dehydrogenase catalytic domain-containing protein [Bacillota bacterium]
MGENMVLSDYKNAVHSPSGVNMSWPLYGQGLENLGKKGRPVELTLPQIRDDQLLVRVDSVGLCFSDIKLITQGNQHPRIFGRDLPSDPVVPGHEATMTVVRVGRDLQDQYKIGERYLIQADVFYQGESMAFGYVLPGALQQYTVLGPEILCGDEGSYILPLRDEDGYAEVALSEPWACVVAAYRITRRETLQPGGNALFVVTDQARSKYTLEGAFALDGLPQQVIILGAQGEFLQQLQQELGERAVLGNLDLSMDKLSQAHTKGQGFDDIVFFGTPQAELVEDAVKVLAKRGAMVFLAETPIARDVAIDIGRIHYDGHVYLGGQTISLAHAYAQRRSAELTPGGSVWMIGAGGPMGQMHTQIAAEDPKGPKLIVVTENNQQRLEELEIRFGPAATARGARLVGLNPRELGNEEMTRRLKDVLAGELFDDVVVMAPSPPAVVDGARWLKDDGILNIFAGVPRGTMADLDLSQVYLSGHRWIGSSGSSLADLRYTLEQIQQKRLRTDRSVAAISGLNAAAEGLRAVQEGSFPGKIVVWPHLPDLPLIALPDLEQHLPNVAAKLSPDGYWTKEAEDELLASQLAEV